MPSIPMDLVSESTSIFDESINTRLKRIVAYVAGPYNSSLGSYYVGKNIRAAETVAANLWSYGFSVVCPHKNAAFMDGVDSDRGFFEGHLDILERCDIVVMTEDWEQSDGARCERRLAYRLGMQVFYWPLSQLTLQRIADNDPINHPTRQLIISRSRGITATAGANLEQDYLSDSIRHKDQVGKSRDSGSKREKLVSGFQS